LCGARSLITGQDIFNFRLPTCFESHGNRFYSENLQSFLLIQSKIANRHLAIVNLDLGLTMRQHSEQAVDREMQQHVSDDRNNDRH